MQFLVETQDLHRGWLNLKTRRIKNKIRASTNFGKSILLCKSYTKHELRVGKRCAKRPDGPVTLNFRRNRSKLYRCQIWQEALMSTDLLKE